MFANAGVGFTKQIDPKSSGLPRTSVPSAMSRPSNCKQRFCWRFGQVSAKETCFG
jgi:hypothetical protein